MSRIEIWKGLLAKAQARMASVDADYPAADVEHIKRNRTPRD